MRRVIEGKRLVQEFSFQPEKLPIGRPIVQYQRVSTDGQVKASLESLIMQDQKLKERLIKYGWKDIIPIDTDLGMSGQKRRDERKGFPLPYER